MTLDDAEVVRRCLAGDEGAFRVLVERYQRQVYSIAIRMLRQPEDAEDVVQEAFVRVFRALGRYDPARPFGAWLCTISTRLCIDHIRRRNPKTISLFQREPGSTEEYQIEATDPGLKPDELAVHGEEEERAMVLIDSLPPHYRIVVLLRHQNDLSYEEIAEALDMPIGTVKARIHRARAILKQRIEGEKS